MTQIQLISYHSNPLHCLLPSYPLSLAQRKNEEEGEERESRNLLLITFMHQLRILFPNFSYRVSLLKITLKVKAPKMDNIVDALNNAYQEFVAAAAGVLEAKESSGGQKTAVTVAALENFKQCQELFRVACDQAEEFVESVKQRVGSECLVDEATGSVTGKPGQAVTTGLPPISAVRLEQMSKAVRWLVIELQQGSGTAGGSSHPHPSAPFDARFSEDAAQ